MVRCEGEGEDLPKRRHEQLSRRPPTMVPNPETRGAKFALPWPFY